jgi:hypothetical protein
MSSPDYVDPVAGAARERATAPAAPDLVKIGEVILGAPADTIDFLAIPQTYRHLRLVVRAKMANAIEAHYSLSMGFNGDLRAGSSVLYDVVHREAQGASAFVAAGNLGAAFFNEIGWIPSSATASFASSTDIEIDDYARTLFEKTIRSRCSSQLGDATALLSNHYEMTAHGRWRSTVAVSRLTIFASSASNMGIGTMASLYGLK